VAQFAGRTGACCGSRSIRGGVGEACGQRNRLLPLRASSSIPKYVRLNPNAVVPTLTHDGRVIIESTVIMRHVDDMFGAPSLMLAEPLARFRTECEPGDESRLE
jgi:Glutathione S-transferase, N-terminal domain